MYLWVFRLWFMYECYVCNCIYEWLKCKANSFSAAAIFSQTCFDFLEPGVVCFSFLPFFKHRLKRDSFSFLLTSRVRIQKSSTPDCLLARYAKSFCVAGKKRAKAGPKILIASSVFPCRPLISGVSHLLYASISKTFSLFVIPSSIFIFFISVPSSCFLCLSCLFKVDGNMPV